MIRTSCGCYRSTLSLGFVSAIRYAIIGTSALRSFRPKGVEIKTEIIEKPSWSVIYHIRRVFIREMYK